MDPVATPDIQPAPIRPGEEPRRAYHESGHVVVASFFGLRVSRVTLQFVQHAHGSGDSGCMRLATLCVAGRVAESIQFGDEVRPSKNDWQAAEAAFGRMTYRIHNPFEYATRRARRILEARWPEVEALATALLERHVLDAADIADVLEACRAEPPSVPVRSGSDPLHEALEPIPRNSAYQSPVSTIPAKTLYFP